MLSTSMKINNEYKHIIITHLGMILMQVQDLFFFFTKIDKIVVLVLTTEIFNIFIIDKLTSNKKYSFLQPITTVWSHQTNERGMSGKSIFSECSEKSLPFQW